MYGDTGWDRAGTFFFNDTATTEIYTLSLHDALPICHAGMPSGRPAPAAGSSTREQSMADRKSTRLNSSHTSTSYAVLCLKKKTRRRASTPASCSRSAEAGVSTSLPEGYVDPTDPAFFFNVTAATEIYTLSLHDALPI